MDLLYIFGLNNKVKLIILPFAITMTGVGETKVKDMPEPSGLTWEFPRRYDYEHKLLGSGTCEPIDFVMDSFECGQIMFLFGDLPFKEIASTHGRIAVYTLRKQHTVVFEMKDGNTNLYE